MENGCARIRRRFRLGITATDRACRLTLSASELAFIRIGLAFHYGGLTLIANDRLHIGNPARNILSRSFAACVGSIIMCC